MHVNRTESRLLVHHGWTASPRKPSRSATEELPAIEQVAEALYELRDLLEEYAPSWYSQEQHERVESAIQRLSQI
jgi:hypothetical protein